MRFGSVCSGIEAASVAWHPLGWKAAWLSEIEPFPCAVLAHHYPDVPNLGDMTTLPERILSGEVEAPDLFCGGTPCQAFSVAGLRNSLDDARGNLSLTFVGIANAIDHVRSVRSDAPGIIFWENVPGVLSTKDNAFGCFLGALAGEDDPIIPSGEKWTNAGCVYGPQRTVAWRVLDAQYFGVAQRRRRVFVVASARDDFDPAAVLFEFDGMRRDSAPSRETGKDTAKCLTSRAGSGGGFDLETETPVIANTIAARTHDALDVQSGTFIPCKEWPTISIHPHCIGRAPEAGPQGKEYLLDGSAYCMDSRGQPQAVVQPIGIFQDSEFGVAQYDSAGTLRAGRIPEHQMVMHPITFHPTQDPISSSEVCHSIGANSNATAAVAQAVSENQRSELRLTDFTYAITSGGGKPGQGYPAALVPAHQYIGGVDYENNAHTMDQPTGPLLKGSPTGGGRPLPAIATAMQVRRLTPVECERLQGFPDGYTNIPWRKKPEAPDGPRYKALGNSWAVPNVHWIGKRIQEALNALP
jgi:DNA (cytosine-5)-methyltransferase 1